MLNVQQFDEQAKGVLTGAYHVARRFAHGTVGSVHLFTALLEQPDSRVPLILDRLAIDRAALAARLDAILRDQPTAGQPTALQQVFIAPAASAAIRRAIEETAPLQSATVAPEHLLLALLRAPETTLAPVLAEFGITHDGVRTVVRALDDAPQ
ncbi:MAG: hypothetical protein IT319_12560 [Anaerolineae bacterium]|nr:hypothetical protein [Anaerolineae bacterium]